MPRYEPSVIEPRWQAFWDKNRCFRTPELEELDRSKPKFYVLDMFPYPSGAGLHVGHPEGYTATDIMARYRRARGFNVLHPMGWDAFGLPAEQYAIATGTHPAVTTRTNCDNFRRQIRRLGLSYDWEREIDTTDPGYYRWTQWIFLKLHDTWFDPECGRGRPIADLLVPTEILEQGDRAVQSYRDARRLAYFDDAQVWWCSTCDTVCANEEVLNDGSHEKCGSLGVEKRNLKQWMLRIPLYAERLLKGLEGLDWPQGIKEMQRNWIGRSEGADVVFTAELPMGGSVPLKVFTTRPDTLFGATYLVLAPEHPLLDELAAPGRWEAVDTYRRQASLRSDLDRTDLSKDKTGVFTGCWAQNPITKGRIPVWVSDYVLMGYGTGAIMAVPAHDERDFAFARSFNLTVRCILDPQDRVDDSLRQEILAGRSCWSGEGILMGSSRPDKSLVLDGLSRDEAAAATITWMEERGLGMRRIQYRLRDWLFSRQRFWGEPFPIIHWDDGSIGTVPESELPVQLPDLESYLPGAGGQSPLANAGSWLDVVDPATGRRGRRETNTMPQWAGSCWYYLRYLSPHSTTRFVDSSAESYWMPVDLYVGGAEHAVLHLLYSRFWHKVLFDLGLVSTEEPFAKLFNQGMILAWAYEDERGVKVPADEVEEHEDGFRRKADGAPLRQIAAKMSKSLRNVVNPDEVVESHGADALRVYEMFMGPLEATKPWQTSGIEGAWRFLSRGFRAIVGDGHEPPVLRNEPPPAALERLRHRTILKVTADIENMRFNTAISQLMVFLNAILDTPVRWRTPCETFVLLLHPFAPHLAEELWERLGHGGGLTGVSWPEGDPEKAIDEECEIALQVNGKLRDTIRVARDLEESELLTLARSNAKVAKFLEGQVIVKEIVVPGRIVNLVVEPA